MSDYTEDDIHYMSGFVDGMVYVAELEADDVRPFDPEEWADHYGDDIVYNNVPLYKSEDDRRNRQNPLNMMEWDADRDIATLTPGKDLPTDRSGSIVFTDGTAARTRDGVRWMFTIPEPLLDNIATIRNHRLTVFREANNREPPRSGKTLLDTMTGVLIIPQLLSGTQYTFMDVYGMGFR